MISPVASTTGATTWQGMQWQARVTGSSAAVGCQHGPNHRPGRGHIAHREARSITEGRYRQPSSSAPTSAQSPAKGGAGYASRQRGSLLRRDLRPCRCQTAPRIAWEGCPSRGSGRSTALVGSSLEETSHWSFAGSRLVQHGTQPEIFRWAAGESFLEVVPSLHLSRAHVLRKKACVQSSSTSQHGAVRFWPPCRPGLTASRDGTTPSWTCPWNALPARSYPRSLTLH